MRQTLTDRRLRVLSQNYVGLGRCYLCVLNAHLRIVMARLFFVTMTRKLGLWVAMPKPIVPPIKTLRAVCLQS